MSNNTTEYRADFYDVLDEVKFSVDSNPTSDPDADPAPLIIHGALIRDDDVEVLRWVRPELESYIGALVQSEMSDVVCVYTVSIEGDVLDPPLSSGISRIEAFAVNSIGGVKSGCLLDVLNHSHSVLDIPTSANYVLEELCYPLNTHVTMFTSNGKHKGKRKRLNA